MVYKILITGSSGFLGQHLIESLLTHPPKIFNPNQNDTKEKERTEIKTTTTTDYEFWITYGGKTVGFATSVISKRNISPRCTITIDKLDLTSDDNDISTWIDDNKPFHMCIHIAAMSSPKSCQDSPKQAKMINNPRHFFQKLKESNPNIIMIALSTDQVYDGGKNLPYVETDEVGPVNVYAATKVEMEKTLKDIYSSKQLFILRSSIICGSEATFGGAHKTFLDFCSTRNGQETDFFTDECRSIVAVSDVVFTIRCIIANFVHQGACSSSSSSDDVATASSSTSTNNKIDSSIYNMGGKDRVSRYDMAMSVFRHFGYDTKCIIAKEKKSMPAPNVPSPLDISMDSSKLEKCVSFSFKGLDEITKETFSNTKCSTKSSE